MDQWTLNLSFRLLRFRICEPRHCRDYSERQAKQEPVRATRFTRIARSIDDDRRVTDRRL